MRASSRRTETRRTTPLRARNQGFRREVPRDSADGRVSWAELPTGARAFRAAHAVFGLVNMASLGYVWLSALRRTRDRRLAGSAALLLTEGAALAIGGGNCPLGSFQRSLGDPVPMFELVLPAKAAKAAVPLLTIVTLAGFAAVLLRPPPASDAALARPPWDETPRG
jgi:hypothetical protein